jgi:hypothetical protein
MYLRAKESKTTSAASAEDRNAETHPFIPHAIVY